MKILRIIPVLLFLWVTQSLTAQEKTSERNVMLNAESATIPREINIGLPESGTGAVIYIDGMKHAMGLPRGYFHWSGGNAYEPVRTMGIIESVIFAGEVGILVDSHTLMGGDVLSGAVTAGTSSNGLIRFDGALNGAFPGLRGWHFAVGAYVNYDPTNVNAPGRPFVEQKQIYQLSLSKRWAVSTLDLSYRFSLCDDNVDNGYAFAPFVYKGDGSIGAYNGFRMGRDCYMPADDAVSWLDIEEGRMRSSRLSRMDRRLLHDLLVRFKHRTQSDWQLSASYHLCRMAPSGYTKIGLASITDAAGQYTLRDGKPYEGKVQNRLVTVEGQWTTDNNLLFEARKDWASHRLRTGLDLVYVQQHEAGSTFHFAHAVAPSPERLLFQGAETWNYNGNGIYYDGFRRSLALYAMHEWTIGKRVRLRTGVRLKGVSNRMFCVPYNRETRANNRKSGHFSLVSPDCKIEDIHFNGLDYAFSESISWRIWDRLFLNGEGFYCINNKTTTHFKGATLPSVKPIANAYGRAGLSYDNRWMDVTAVVSYISSWNNAKVMDVSDSASGETIPWTAEYGIRTWGVTLEGNLHFGGFRLHLLGTWQDPRYTNYRNEFNFSSGVKVIDYTGKFVTGISQYMAEFDPSYTWKRYRVWASVRYYSRQYASRNNLAWFNGHFETFAGVDAGFGKRSKVSLNLVNVLWQNGAKGSLDIVDTVEDASILQDYLIAGTYIRPFTVELSYTFKF